MSDTTPTHLIVTTYALPGAASIIPTDWRDRLATIGEDPAEWTEWEAASTFEDTLCTVDVTWGEDETFETFEKAVNDAGYTIVGPVDGDTYPAIKTP